MTLGERKAERIEISIEPVVSLELERLNESDIGLSDRREKRGKRSRESSGNKRRKIREEIIKSEKKLEEVVDEVKKEVKDEVDTAKETTHRAIDPECQTLLGSAHIFCQGNYVFLRNRRREIRDFFHLSIILKM